MYRNFSINENEKRQILEMHTSNGYKRSLNEQDDNRFRANDIIVGRGSGATGVFAKIDESKVSKWLNGCGNPNLGTGNNPKTKQIANLFIKGIDGLDITGGGEKMIQQAVDQYVKLDLVNQNQVIMDYCKSTKNYESAGFLQDIVDDSDFYANVLVDSKNKIKQYCSVRGSSYEGWVTYSDEENGKLGNKKPSEQVMKICGDFYTTPKGSVLF